MKKTIIALFFILLFICACGDESIGSVSSPDESNVNTESKKISAEEALAIMDESTEFILLDVRTDEEYKEKRINGSILIPDYEISSRIEEELPDKNALILVYCRSGRRSANAVMEMIGMGYTNVFDIGGIVDWPYDTISG